MSESASTARCILNSEGAVEPPRRVRPWGQLSGWGRVLELIAVLLLLAAPAAAQHSKAASLSSGILTGQVVDSESLRPLEGALVTLRRLERGPPEAAQGGRFYQSTLTDTAGEYRFDGLVPSRYRVVVQRIGYLATGLEVELRSSTRVSLGMEVEPVLLPPVRVMGAETEPYTAGEGMGREPRTTRAEVARSRQAEYLTSDTRELTHADVVEAVTLAETDLFRALQRMPGVGTRDDYTATLWTRGAAWDQTRVYLDELPLYNPTHAGWLFSAVNPDAVGEVAFHPGVRSARWGEGAAAVLDLRSRTGGGKGIRGRGELSLASARVALDGTTEDGQFSWMVAGRRTYVDLLTSAYGSVTGDDEAAIPYDFSDLVARVDGRIGDGWGYSASGILERDRLRGDVPGILRDNQGEWGNRAGQVSVHFPLGPLQGRLSAGETRFQTAILEKLSERRSRERRSDPTLPALETTIQHQVLSVEIEPAQRAATHHWALGAKVLRDTVAYVGPFSLLSDLAVVLPGERVTSNFNFGRRLRYQALWGEYRWEPTGRLALETGVRAEFGPPVRNGGRWRVAPRAAGRFTISDATSLSAGWMRSYQYTQDIAPVAGPLGPQLHLSHLWVLADTAQYPAIRADVSTVGVEHWVGEGLLLSANAYHRAATGVTIPNPDSGRVVLDRPPYAVASNSASGVELSARRLIGGVTLSLGYALGTSTMRAPSPEDSLPVTFASSADVRHALDAAVLAEVGNGWRLGGAFTYGSGVPYTRLILPDTSRPADPVLVDDANEKRAPAYASLDLATEYTVRSGSWEITAYAQLRNALGRENSVTYSGSRACGGFTLAAASAAPCQGGVTDNFQPGLPRLPLFGVRVRF
jgi:hypothetical protein